MAKTVIKEIIIMLLLCLAIILLLGILLYENVPMTKTIPNPVSYTTPNNVKQELADTDGIDESQVIMTYEVDATDLNNYSSIQNYKPGKANPFSSYEATGQSATSTSTANSAIGNTQTKENGVTTGTTTTTGTNTDTTTTPTTNNNEMTNAGNSQTSSSLNTQPNTGNSQDASTEGKTTTSGGQFFQDKGTK